MDLEKSYELIKSLAEGIDPITGWVLPADHTCQHPEIIRALYAAAQALEREVKREKRLQRARLGLPPNTGKTWPVEEDSVLLKRFSAGADVAELAKLHRRTVGAIRARLEKLGQLPPARGPAQREAQPSPAPARRTLVS
jgi:aminoglycoside phosphotransferase